MAPRRSETKGTSRRTVERVMEVTGASEEDVLAVLAECKDDVNQATHLLLDNPFEEVCNKKGKKSQRESTATVSNEETKANPRIQEAKRPAQAPGMQKVAQGNPRSGKPTADIHPRANGHGVGKGSGAASTGKPVSKPVKTNKSAGSARTVPSVENGHKGGTKARPSTNKLVNQAKAAPRPSGSATASGKSFTDIVKGPPVVEVPAPTSQEESTEPRADTFPQSAPTMVAEERDEELVPWGQQRSAEGDQASWKERVSALGPIGGQQQGSPRFSSKEGSEGPVLPRSVPIPDTEHLPLQFGQISVNNSGLPEFGAGFNSTFAGTSTEDVVLAKPNEFSEVGSSSLPGYALPTELQTKTGPTEQTPPSSSAPSQAATSAAGDAGMSGPPPGVGPSPQYYGYQPGSYPFMVPPAPTGQQFMPSETENKTEVGQPRHEMGPSSQGDARSHVPGYSSTPMATPAPPLPPMAGYSAPGVPPGMGAQFGPAVYPTYPYMAPPSAAYYMPNPYNPYGPPAGGYVPHGGAGFPGASAGLKQNVQIGSSSNASAMGAGGYGPGSTKAFGSSRSGGTEEGQIPYTTVAHAESGASQMQHGTPGIVPGDFGVGGYFNMPQGAYQQGSYAALSGGSYMGQYQQYGQPLGMQQPQGGL